MTSPLADVQIRLVEGIEDLWDMKRWLGERRDGTLATDTETCGFNPWKDGLRLVQFGDRRTAFVLPFEEWKGAVREVIRDYEGDWVCHNAPFEQKFFQVNLGIQLPWHRLHDTMVQAKLDNPLKPAGLKPVSDRLVDRSSSGLQKALDDGMSSQGWTWATVPLNFQPYWAYAGLDTILTSHVDGQLRPKVLTSCPEAYSLEMATLRVTTNMMINGMLVDVPYVESAIAKFRKFSQETRTWLKSAHGITSPMSSGQLRKAFDRLGCEPLSYTDQGAPQYTKENLTFYQHNASNEEARTLARYLLLVRHADKMTSSYLENFLELRDSNGLIHASINTMAARTGRMSITDPALQTLPRDDKVVRGSFIPHSDFALITSDLDQVEMRLASHFSADPGLIEAFLTAERTGVDFFTTLARMLYQDESIDKKDRRRQSTKNVGYAKIYGSGVETMSRTAGVPLEQIKAVNDAFDQRFPGLKRLLEDTTNEGMQCKPPMIRSPLGRPLVADHGREFTQLTNAKIQGHAAEYLKQRLIILDASGLGDALRLPIHDEVIVEVHRSEAEEAARLVSECMSDRTSYLVPITAGADVLEERWEKR